MATSEAAATSNGEVKRLMSDVVSEAFQTTSDALNSVEQMCSQVRSILEDDTSGGISLLDLKNHDLSAYVMNLGLLMGKMSMGESIEHSPALDQLVKLRVVLERIRPIERKMRAQIDQLLRGGDQDNKELNMHARPELFDVDGSENENSGSDEEDGGEVKKERKYQAPKMVPMHFDENADEKRMKQMERARKRAMQSSLIQDLRAQYSDAPTLIRDGPTLTRMQEEQRKFEENNYVRLHLTKHEKNMTRRKENKDTLDSLLKFGDYMAVDNALAGQDHKKKARGQKRRTGPGGHKKKSAKKRKF